MSRLALDLRMAFDALVRGRFVSVLAVLAFALGIGVTTAVFTIFNAVILRPLPYPDPDRLVVNISFKAGASTNIEVIDAQRAARDADLVAAIAENQARQARLALLVALGLFP